MNVGALQKAAIVTIWFVVVVSIATEFSEPLKASLTSLFGHHWTAKSILAAILFFVVYGLLSRERGSKHVLAGAFAVCASAIAGGLAIFSFFVWHFFLA